MTRKVRSRRRLGLSAKQNPSHPAGQIADRIARQAAPVIGGMIDTIEGMLGTARDLEEFRQMLVSAQGSLDVSGLAEVIGPGLDDAFAAGQFDQAEESGHGGHA